MNRFVCFLTGGHRYVDELLRVYRCDEDEKFIFRNYCVKCHKPITITEIPFKAIFPEWFMEGEEE